MQTLIKYLASFLFAMLAHHLPVTVGHRDEAKIPSRELCSIRQQPVPVPISAKSKGSFHGCYEEEFPSGYETLRGDDCPKTKFS